jgi:hypothetical protein
MESLTRAVGLVGLIGIAGLSVNLTAAEEPAQGQAAGMPAQEVPAPEGEAGDVQSRGVPLKPGRTAPFSCGPHMATYEAYDLNRPLRGGQFLKHGIRCVKVWHPDPFPNSVPQFVWYGEGRTDKGAYRHLGLVQPPDARGAATTSNPSRMVTLRVTKVTGSWPTPDEIFIGGEWAEVWKRVERTAYLPLPSLTNSCEGLGSRYYVTDAREVPSPDSFRCVNTQNEGKMMWFGQGRWGLGTYTHVGLLESRLAQNSRAFGSATDLCGPTFGTYCGTTTWMNLSFLQVSQGGYIQVTGVWNERWYPEIR